MSEDGEVFGIGEFEVALFAGNEGDVDFGAVAEHHAAVVGGAKVGVGQRTAVGFEEHRRVETLRGLHSAQQSAVGHAAHSAVGVDFDEGIDDGQRNIGHGVAV